MSNLFDQRNNQPNPEGYNPRPVNNYVKAQASGGEKFFYGIFAIGTLGIYPIKLKNRLNAMQNQVNTAASTIDTQVAKRTNIIISLTEAASSYLKHEREIFEEVAKFRGMMGQMQNAASATESAKIGNELNNGLTGFMSRLIAVSENYPDLKADKVVRDLMEQSVYLENEIAAARRLYNTYVNEFNTSITTFPTNVKAAKMNLSTLELFQAKASDYERPSTKLN